MAAAGYPPTSHLLLVGAEVTQDSLGRISYGAVPDSLGLEDAGDRVAAGKRVKEPTAGMPWLVAWLVLSPLLLATTIVFPCLGSCLAHWFEDWALSILCRVT